MHECRGVVQCAVLSVLKSGVEKLASKLHADSPDTATARIIIRSVFMALLFKAYSAKKQVVRIIVFCSIALVGLQELAVLTQKNPRKHHAYGDLKYNSTSNQRITAHRMHPEPFPERRDKPSQQHLSLHPQPWQRHHRGSRGRTSQQPLSGRWCRPQQRQR